MTDTGVDPSNPSRRTAVWGFGDGIYNMGDPVEEDVNQMLFRQVRWFVDTAKPDGFRLDAVKHVPSYFFGKQSGGDKDNSNAGYTGQIQEQFNITRGHTDWGNHRNTVFENSLARDDALLFGEHLGAPPDDNPYLEAGMRIASDQFLNTVGGFGGIGNNLFFYDQPGHGTKGTVDRRGVPAEPRQQLHERRRPPGRVHLHADARGARDRLHRRLQHPGAARLFPKASAHPVPRPVRPALGDGAGEECAAISCGGSRSRSGRMEISPRGRCATSARIRR